MITTRPAKVPAIIGTAESTCVSESGAVVIDAADADENDVDDETDMTGLVRGIDDSVLVRMGNDVGFNDELQRRKKMKLIS